MTLLHGIAGFVIGLIAGIGVTLFYLKWKMQRQLGNLEEQMGAMMDMTGEADDMLAGIEEEIPEAPEDIDENSNEKEEK